MDSEPHIEPIPRPPGHMVVGNLLDVDAAHPIESAMELARKYGPIYELAVPGASRVIVSSFELVDELCDESRFDKKVAGGLSAVSKGPAGGGLFTSETDDPRWRKAHNVLLPPSAWMRCAATFRGCWISPCSSCKNGSGLIQRTRSMSRPT